MTTVKAGFAFCGSFCTFESAFTALESLQKLGWDLYPIMSEFAYETDTRFGKAEEHRRHMAEVCGRDVIHRISDAEPIGPKKMFDILIVAPCTGNTLGKLAGGITDTAVTMATKSHLRNQRPVLLAVSTNDALLASAGNIGKLLGRKHFYFVPMGQDAPESKPNSMVAKFDLLAEAAANALVGKQMQPVFAGK